MVTIILLMNIAKHDCVEQTGMNTRGNSRNVVVVYEMIMTMGEENDNWETKGAR